MKTVIVIPTYNEQINIGDLLQKIFLNKIENLEVIIIDDNSPDGTANYVEKLREIYPIYLIKRIKKMGIGSAYIKGFKKALFLKADYIFEMDADFSHDPADIPRLLEKMTDYDLVIGSRKIKGGEVIGWNYWRRIISTGAMIFARIILGLKPKDVTAGFRCYRRKVLETINLETIKSNGYAFQEEMLFKTQKLGFKIGEVPVIFKDRSKGKSKLGKKDVLEFFVVMMKLRLGR